MRSRTEMVTTTFVDSEDESEDDSESEDDWRPTSTNKKRSLKSSKSRQSKRRSAKKKKISDSDDDDDDDEDDNNDSEDDDYSDNDYLITSMEPSLPTVEIPEEKLNSKNDEENDTTFNLLLYRKDLDKNYKSNTHLCLWRRERGSLLQKYIRVKTENNDDFVFTSSSVYSSWDEKSSSDFVEIIVKSLKENPKRVKIIDNESIYSLALKESEKSNNKNKRQTETEKEKETDTDDTEEDETLELDHHNNIGDNTESTSGEN